MSYITSNDYLSFAGGDLPSGFEELASRSSDMIDQRTLHDSGTLASLPEKKLALVKRACCAQAQWLDLKGGPESLASPATAEATLGKFSFRAESAQNFSPLATGYLFQAGLLYSGVTTK